MDRWTLLFVCCWCFIHSFILYHLSFLIDSLLTMKIALSLALSLLLVSADGFVPQARRPAFAPTATTAEESLRAWSTALFLTVVWNEPRTLAWMPSSPSSSSSSNDGMVTAMAMLKQANMELSEVSSTTVTNNKGEVADSNMNKNSIQCKDTPASIQSRAEQWERSVFDAMEQMELQIEESAHTTGKRTLQLVQRVVVEPLLRLRMPSWDAKRSMLLDLQKLERLEQTVFNEMERLEHVLEQTASNTGAYSLKVVQAAMESIRAIENHPQARRAKIVYTQKLASLVRDMADRLERHAAQETLAVVETEEEVLVTSKYSTRVRPTHRRRPGIISSFLTRLVWKVSAKWHRA